ncbi:MAG: HigA family addiction module antitoxin [Eubacteriales bacterium]|nr:HigA family addiction module antitoxin [Eubacteriales bacterium]
MAAKNHGISLDLLIHPGETISDILEDRDITQKELALRSGVSEAFLSDVIHGKKDISKSFAMGLEYALGVPSSFWLNLQANYDAELISLQEENTINDGEREVFSNIHEVVKYLQGCRLIPLEGTAEQLIICTRKVLQVSNLTRLRTLAPTGAFRLSDKAPIDPDVLGAWLSICKVQGADRQLSSGFNTEKIDQLIAEIKQIMLANKGDPQPALIGLFAQYGIDFSVVHNFRGAPVHGYIARKEDNTYQMVLTIRGSFADIFWFSLFHELGHIVNGDLSKAGSFIDADYSKDSLMETAADEFASNSLLSPEPYQRFVDAGSFSYSSIAAHARKQNVPPYVVIGRLQKEKKIPWSRFTRYKPRFKWAEG